MTDGLPLPMIRRVGNRNLPSGTVTFLVTDVEGSTKLLHALGADGYADALAAHRATLRDAFTIHGGVEVDTQGDAFFVAFPTAPGALAAALQASTALAAGPIHVRIGLHTGSPLLTDEGYVGADVHKGARIAAAGHRGQVLLSAASLEVRRRAGSPEVCGLGARAGLCHVLVATNRAAEARETARELLAASRGTDAAYAEQLALHFLADADLLDGDWPAAEAAYRKALSFSVEHDFVGRATDEVIGMAMAMAGAGRADDALVAAAAARAKQAEIGKGSDAWWASMQERHLGDARASIPDADAAAAEGRGRETPFDAAVADLLGRE